MAGLVQNQSQIDENFRGALRQSALMVGRSVPFVPGQVKPSVAPEKRLQAGERRRVPKGFMGGSPTRRGGSFIQALAQLFLKQRR